MSLVGLSLPHLRVALDLAPPVLPAGRGTPVELLQLDGAHLRPDALGSPQIRDSAFGGDAGAAEGHQLAAVPHQGGELGFELSVHPDTAAGNLRGGPPRVRLSTGIVKYV